MKKRIHLAIRGAVQGVGFRPFIYRLAAEIHVKGYVLNSPMGVFIEADGEKALLDTFVLRIQNEKPPHAVITGMEFSFLDPGGFDTFEIRESISGGDPTAFILPDIAVCEACAREMRDPDNRRYRYPFINCTHCGPRFSIIESLPYDRPNTSMKTFEMCDACRREYENPLDRRFHAQPIACPQCGPHIELWDPQKNVLSRRNDALLLAVKKICEGATLAFKGLGGYHLICDAGNEKAVARLREKKRREEKPFAIMFPTLGAVKEICDVSAFEERLLLSSESPIVLLRRKNLNDFNSAAPGNPYFGVMLPYTPLHHLLMAELNSPIVATSGNLSEEPMCIDEEEAVTRLHGIADYFLTHDRPILRPVDDSIVRVILGREMVMRRARGYAPLPVPTYPETDYSPRLAVGGHLKNTIALYKNKQIFLSQHIGDLSTYEAYSSFRKTIDDFRKLYNTPVGKIVHDLHPEYLSTKYAAAFDGPRIGIQHHEAHCAACRAENQVQGPALGVAWDGTGYGHDGTIWGSEFFITDGISFRHAGQFRQFSLPGGEKAVKEPRFSALGVFYEIYGETLFRNYRERLSHFTPQEVSLVHAMLDKKLNTPMTSSAGRLFDAAASIIGVSQKSNFEGQSAMKLEYAADPAEKSSYDFEIKSNKLRIIDWQPMIEQILMELDKKIPLSTMAAKFHNTLAIMILAMANHIGESKVLLSGGCFQNALLLETTVRKLESGGFQPYWHQRVPTNDGGIALGQIAASLEIENLPLPLPCEENLVSRKEMESCALPFPEK